MKKTAIVLLLTLLLCSCAQAGTLTAEARRSDTLSQGALLGVQAFLQGCEARVDATGVTLLANGEALLSAAVRGNAGVIGSGDTAAAFDAPADGGWQGLLEAARALGEMLKAYETARGDSVDLQEAGTCRSQLVYALSGEEWAAVWPQTVSLLAAAVPQAAALADARIEGKGTFKRYFDADGGEIGAYFYAASMTVQGETREVRLEYAWRAGKGLYVAFRCPNARQTRNVRIAVHGRAREDAATLSVDIRRIDGQDSDVWTLEARQGKRVEAALKRKREGRQNEYALTLQPAAEEWLYEYRVNGDLALAGAAVYRPEGAPLPPGEARQSLAEVGAALSLRLAGALRALCGADVLQALHALQAPWYVEGETTQLTPEFVDPAYMVTEGES